MIFTFLCMHYKRLINAPLLQTNIAMHLSIWRQHDYIWRFSDATRGGSIGFQRCKIAFYRYTGDYEQIFDEAFIQTICFLHCSIFFLNNSVVHSSELGRFRTSIKHRLHYRGILWTYFRSCDEQTGCAHNNLLW